MPLSQVQIIRSLGEALAWFERESRWGVPAAELRHLTGRIGELYAAMLTRGQMALAVNQHGYDVVSAEGQHISVKTFTTSTHVDFTKSTFGEVHRVLILKVSVIDYDAVIETVFDGSREAFLAVCHDAGDKYQFFPFRAAASKVAQPNVKTVVSVTIGARTVTQYENGTIIVTSAGQIEPSAMAALRQIASEIGVSQLNSQGNPRNTRQLGAEIIATMKARAGEGPPEAPVCLPVDPGPDSA